ARLQLTAECAFEQAEMCADNRPGHSVHLLQLRVASATRTKWTDAIVLDVHPDGWLALSPVDEGGERLRVWNHADLSRVVHVGDPVAVHTLYNVLAVGRQRFSVVIERKA